MDEYKQKLLVSFSKKKISKDAYIFGSFPYLIVSWDILIHYCFRQIQNWQEVSLWGEANIHLFYT